MGTGLIIIFIFFYTVNSVFTQTCPDRCKTCKASANYICTSCQPMYWDIRPHMVCQKECPTTCATEECDDTNGVCKECPAGFYGAHCKLSCDVCKKRLCDVYKCTEGCKDGYFGETDDRGIMRCKPCKRLNCLSCSEELTCDVCDPGYFVHEEFKACWPCSKGCTTCKSSSECTSCVDGKYGPNRCQFDCAHDHCLACDLYGDICTKCEPGFLLEDNACVHCSKNCPDGCSPDGTCQGQCKTRYSGARCDQPCSSLCKHCAKVDSAKCTQCYGDFYGQQCQHLCSVGCRKEDFGTSSCKIGGACHSCSAGRFGLFCNRVCPLNCKHELCHRKTGACTHGCLDGFKGDKCEEKITKILDGVTKSPTTPKSPTTSTSPDYNDNDNSSSAYVFSYYEEPDHDGDDHSIATTETPKPGIGSANKSEQTTDSQHNIFLYIGLGVGLCVTLLVSVGLAGIISKRRNTRPKKSPGIEPRVTFSHGSNAIGFSDKAATESQYDYIGYEPESKPKPHQGSNSGEYDSNGYAQPSITVHDLPNKGTGATYDSGGYLKPSVKDHNRRPNPSQIGKNIDQSGHNTDAVVYETCGYEQPLTFGGHRKNHNTTDDTTDAHGYEACGFVQQSNFGGPAPHRPTQCDQHYITPFHSTDMNTKLADKSTFYEHLHAGTVSNSLYTDLQPSSDPTYENSK